MNKSLIAAGFLSALATSAIAHSTLEQTEVAAGTITKITLRVPHGCDGQATHTVELTMPDGFYAAKPMPKAGWTLETETADYATPYEMHGHTMTQGVQKVTWSGGNLEDGWYDEFTVRGTVGRDVASNTVLYFPALQTCADGTADWTDTSGSHDVPNPAPKLTVTAAEMHAGHDHGDRPGEITLGDLTLSGGFSRATLPNAPVAGGFMTIVNNGDSDDRLVAASSPVSSRVEIHEMKMENDVMKMRELADGLPIPAGATVKLQPGGYHIMFMQIEAPFVEGETVNATLTFEKAGEVTVPLAIGAPNARGARHGNHSDHSGHAGMAKE